MKFKKNMIFYMLIFSIILCPQYILQLKYMNSLVSIINLGIIAIELSILIIKRKIMPEGIELVIFFDFIYLFLVTIIKCKEIDINRFTTEIVIVALILLLENHKDTDYNDIIDVLCKVCVIWMILNFLSVIIFPNGLYIQNTIKGNRYLCWLWGYKNPMGRMILTTIGLCYINAIINKGILGKYEIFSTIIGLLTLIFVKSTTSMISVIILLIAVFISKDIKIPKIINLATIYIGAFVLSYLLVFYQIQYSNQFINKNILRVGKSLTLNGREIIWDRTVNVIKESMFFGNGLERYIIVYNNIGAAHAHNFFLHILYISGLVGLVLMTLLNFIEARILLKYDNTKISRVALALFGAILVNGITESLTDMPLFLTMYVIVAHILKNVKENDAQKLSFMRMKIRFIKES